jgi:hypothetical protein
MCLSLLLQCGLLLLCCFCTLCACRGSVCPWVLMPPAHAAYKASKAWQRLKPCLVWLACELAAVVVQIFPQTGKYLQAVGIMCCWSHATEDTVLLAPLRSGCLRAFIS